MSGDSSQTLPAPGRPDTTSWWPIAAAATLLLSYVWVFWDFLRTQVMWAVRHQADWGHTLVIPFIAGYFVYLRREPLLARPFRTTWVGLLPIVLGVGWYAVCSLVDVARNHNLQGFGVWLTLVGLVLLFCGWRAMRHLWFPLVFLLIFGQSISDRAMSMVTLQMQDIAARGAHFVLVLMGFDVDLTGNTLWLVSQSGQSHPLNIAEACSGMRMLMAFLALGVAMAYTGLPRLWQRAILIAMAVPTAIFVNILRVVTLGLLSMLDSGLASGDFHTFVGLVWLLPALGIYMGLTWIILNMVVERPQGAADER